jgi:hypothetical protein
MPRPLCRPALPLALALIVALPSPPTGRADVAPPVEVTPARAAALAGVFRVAAEPSKARPGLTRVVVSGPHNPGVLVTVHLTLGPPGRPQLRSELAVKEQDRPNGGGGGQPKRSWYAEFEATAETARDSRLSLFLAETKGPPQRTEYEIPVKNFSGG